MKCFIKKHYEKNKSFVKYAYTGIVVTLMNIFLLWLFIDMFNIPTLISSTIIVGGLFLLKFWLYKKTGFAQ